MIKRTICSNVNEGTPCMFFDPNKEYCNLANVQVKPNSICHCNIQRIDRYIQRHETLIQSLTDILKK